MQNIYFISDAHLGSEAKDKELAKIELLLNFLDFVRQQADILYIVGDLFDFWFEYRHAIPKTSLKILAKLFQLVEKGVQVRYFAGNHDLWLGNFLQQELGIKIYHEPLDVIHNGLKFYIAHGDGLAKGDRGYRFLKRIFKNRLNIFLYRWLHPDVGVPLAKFFSNRSRTKGENPFDEDYWNLATSLLGKGYDVVIFGHTHKPLFKRIDGRYYINLGDWIENFTYLHLKHTTLQLYRWPSRQLFEESAKPEHTHYFKV
ncbi:MAG: UDP-2,3-diacylglucosamine diphosphatase [Calditrichaeota bacterium]|nr:MAG: UDP-2,3-diacylglucosamine diphosphatase [Calditrichota bacterium]